MSIKKLSLSFPALLLDVQLQTCRKGLHTLDYFTVFIMVSSLGLLLHQQCSTGFFPSCAKMPQIETKVAEGKSLLVWLVQRVWKLRGDLFLKR